MPGRRPILALLAVLTAGTLACRAEDPPDYTRVSPESLGIKLVAPKKDPRTGFVVGGKNPTSRIRKLKEIAGRSIAALEKDMRPGAMSRAGFLGKDERLLDVMARDNVYVVEKRKLTHQELARHLHALCALAVKHAHREPKEILYHARRFKVKATCYKGSQDSPFKDGTETSCDATVENLGNGKKLSYSLLVPYLIERYGFYEGKGTSYRVDPQKALEVLDFLEPARGR
jgi:hypothetical protein